MNIHGHRTSGWTVAVLMAARAIGEGFLGAAEPRLTRIGIQFGTALALLPVVPAIAAWIAAQQNWTVVAWTSGILSVALAVVVIVWLVRNADS